MKRILLSTLAAMALTASAQAQDMMPEPFACSGIFVNSYYAADGQTAKKTVKTAEKFNLVVDPVDNTITIQDPEARLTQRYSGVITLPSHYVLDGNFPDSDRASHNVILFLDRHTGSYRLFSWTNRARPEPIQLFSTQGSGICQPNRLWKP